MVKILKPGKNRRPIRICPQCKCEFLFDYSDTFSISSIQEITNQRGIYCPDCGHKVKIKYFDIIDFNLYQDILMNE